MLLVFISLLFGGLVTESLADSDSELQQAQGYFENSNYQQAEQTYQGIIKQSDANQALEAQKGLVMVYISWDKQAEAESAYQQLLLNFPHNTHMADVIHHGIASHYRKCEKDNKADELDKYVLTNWPTTESAMWAQADIIKSEIDANDYTTAQVGVDNLFAGFANNEHIGDAIHSVAYRYRQSEKTAKADELDTYVLNHCLKTESGMWAQVDVINSNIDSKDYTTAQTGINNLLTSFSSNANMANVLHGMAYKYRQVQEVAKADELDRYIISKWPKTESSMWAQVDIINSNINSKDYTAAQTGVNDLLASFSSNANMANVLHGMAYKYRQAQETTKADELDKYVLNHWPSSELALWAKVDTLKSDVNEQNYTTALANADNLLTNFSNEEQLVFGVLAFQIIDKYGQVNQDEKANQFYKKLISNWPGNKYTLWSQTVAVLASIKLSNITATEAAIEKLNTDFSNQLKFPNVTLIIAEKCYEQGLACQDDPNKGKSFLVKTTELLDAMAKKEIADSMLKASIYYTLGLNYYAKARVQNVEGNTEEGKIYYRKAIETWERLISEFPNSNVTPDAYYVSAVCYAQELDEYQKGIDYFRKVVDNWPDYEYAQQAKVFIADYNIKMQKK